LIDGNKVIHNIEQYCKSKTWLVAAGGWHADKADMLVIEED